MSLCLQNGSLNLCVMQQSENEVVLSLTGKGASLPAAVIPYSVFTPYSLGRPWKLEKSCFHSIRCFACMDGIMVEGNSSLFRIRDHFMLRKGVLEITRSWTMLCDLKEVVLGTRVPAGNAVREKITIPAVLYNNNPAADPARLVPHLPVTEDGALVVEEHRVSIPGINVEYFQEDLYSALTLFCMPSRTPGGENWSLGVLRNEQGTFDLLSLSGVVSFDEKRDHLYGTQCTLFHQEDFGYLDLKKGDVIRKTLYLDLTEGFPEGRGFTVLVNKGMELYSPEEKPVLTLEDVIRLKYNALENRYLETPVASGFRWILEGVENGNVYNAKSGFLYGWVGQSLLLAYCALKAGLQGDEKWMNKALNVLDHFASAPEAGGTPGLKYLFQDHISGQWYNCEFRDKGQLWSRLAGESLANLANCLLLLKEHGYPVRESWERALKRGVDFLLDQRHWTENGTYPISYTAEGIPMDQILCGAGTACVDAVIRASVYFQDPEMKKAALQILDRYNELFLKTLRNPFSRATLDAACEDKEAGIYFFLAAYHAYCSTGEKKYEEYALTSALWISTFVYFWSVPFRPGSICADHGFDSVFWPGVSVQNMHLDVYFPAYEVYDFGKRIGNEVLCRIGKGVMSAWTHGICRFPGDWNLAVPGEQGEQFFHTNFYQGRFDESAWRGGANAWNPVWIVALVLSAALKFRGDGVKSVS